MSDVLRPDELEMVPSSDQRELKLTFRCEDGQSREVVLTRSDIPKIIAELGKWTVSRPVTINSALGCEYPARGTEHHPVASGHDSPRLSTLLRGALSAFLSRSLLRGKLSAWFSRVP